MLKVVLVTALMSCVASQELIRMGSGEEKTPKAYSYTYQVNDEVTGDVKTAYESSEGDGVVTGEYSFIQPDGNLRTVSYQADEINGFVAHVQLGSDVATPIEAPVRTVVEAAPEVVQARPAIRTVIVPAAERPAIHTVTVPATSPTFRTVPAGSSIIRTSQWPFFSRYRQPLVYGRQPLVYGRLGYGYGLTGSSNLFYRDNAGNYYYS